MSISIIIYSIFKYSYLSFLLDYQSLFSTIFLSLVKDDNLEVRNLTLKCISIFKVRLPEKYEKQCKIKT